MNQINFYSGLSNCYNCHWRSDCRKYSSSIDPEGIKIFKAPSTNQLVEARCTFVYTNGILEESQGIFAHSLGTRLCQIRTINSRKCFPSSTQGVNIPKLDPAISCYYQVAHEGEEG